MSSGKTRCFSSLQALGFTWEFHLKSLARQTQRNIQIKYQNVNGENFFIYFALSSVSKGTWNVRKGNNGSQGLRRERNERSEIDVNMSEEGSSWLCLWYICAMMEVALLEQFLRGIMSLEGSHSENYGLSCCTLNNQILWKWGISLPTSALKTRNSNENPRRHTSSW